MSNPFDSITFNELCLEVNASAPWVKKVQGLFKLKGGEGKRGVRSHYTREQVNIYRRIKELRLLDIEFEAIDQIMKNERELEYYTHYTVDKEAFSQNSKDQIAIGFIVLYGGNLFRVAVLNKLKPHEVDVLKKFVLEQNRYQDYILQKAKVMANMAQNIIDESKANLTVNAKLLE